MGYVDMNKQIVREDWKGGNRNQVSLLNGKLPEEDRSSIDQNQVMKAQHG